MKVSTGCFVRIALAAGTILAGLASSPTHSTAAEPRRLADGTVEESWRLANGLLVVTRHIPDASAVAITVGYRLGSETDPRGREGLARLLGEVAYLSRTRDVPERSREEMPSLRPLGWSLRVTPSFLLMSEIASVQQFPGALHQMAVRMRGVTVTESGLRTAIARVSQDLERSYSTDLGLSLYYRLRRLAEGADQKTLERYASGKGISGLSVTDVQRRIDALFVPANAILGLAGNWGNLDLRHLIEDLLGDAPPGDSLPRRAIETLQPGAHDSPQTGIDRPTGVVGVIAPALADTLHPSFYLHTLLLGTRLKSAWEPPASPLMSRFEYPVLDEPELVRLYPPVSPESNHPRNVASPLTATLREISLKAFPRESYELFKPAVLWLLGGPMQPQLRERVASDPTALNTVCSAMVSRLMWKDEDFWAEYRRRFERAGDADYHRWQSYYISASNHVLLRLTPRGSD